jgi:hypothetical protein
MPENARPGDTIADGLYEIYETCETDLERSVFRFEPGRDDIPLVQNSGSDPLGKSESLKKPRTSGSSSLPAGATLLVYWGVGDGLGLIN